MDVKTALIKGLTSNPKYIPLWYRYDKQGSVYNDLCLEENKHYYFHRAEIEVLADHIHDIVAEVPEDCTLVDFGSGNSTKTRAFIDQLLQKQGKLTYVPVDISTDDAVVFSHDRKSLQTILNDVESYSNMFNLKLNVSKTRSVFEKYHLSEDIGSPSPISDFIKEVCQTLSTEYGNSLAITPIYGSYDTAINSLRAVNSPKFILWFGSLQNLGYEDQVSKLQRLSENMTENDRLLVSLDITTDPQLIYNAYLDPEGHSANLYYNSLWRLNREYGSNFDECTFNLVGQFLQSKDPESNSKFQVRLKSISDQTIDIPGLGLTVTLKDGEDLNLYEGEGNSCKYTVEQIETLMRKGTFRIRKQWFCKNKHVAFTLV